MSNISSVYDALKARIVAVLTTHTQIPNPYELSENSEQVLKKGYGIKFGPADNTNRVVCAQMSVDRDMLVVLTRKIYSSEMNTSAKDTAWKQLFEDQKLLIADVEADPTLANSSAVTNAKFIGDTGLSFIFAEQENFVSVETTIRVEYFETF